MHFCINTKEEVMIGIIPWGHKKGLVQDEITKNWIAREKWMWPLTQYLCDPFLLYEELV